VENSFHLLRTITLNVRIFDSQKERASLAPRVEPVKERGSRPSHVKISGGGRRKANARFLGLRHALFSVDPKRFILTERHGKIEGLRPGNFGGLRSATRVIRKEGEASYIVKIGLRQQLTCDRQTGA